MSYRNKNKLPELSDAEYKRLLDVLSCHFEIGNRGKLVDKLVTKIKKETRVIKELK